VVLAEVAGAGKKMFMEIDVAIRPIAVTRIISGLILTPSVSSSKNLSRPALEAGIGAFFFLLLIAVDSLAAEAGLPF
jgi:hypothetical protein